VNRRFQAGVPAVPDEVFNWPARRTGGLTAAVNCPRKSGCGVELNNYVWGLRAFDESVETIRRGLWAVPGAATGAAEVPWTIRRRRINTTADIHSCGVMPVDRRRRHVGFLANRARLRAECGREAGRRLADV